MQPTNCTQPTNQLSSAYQRVSTRGDVPRPPQISGRGGGAVMQKSPRTFLPHNNAIAGFTSQSLDWPAYASKTDSCTAIKLAPRMHQNLPFWAQNCEKKNFWGGAYPFYHTPPWWAGGHPLLTRQPSAFRSSHSLFSPWIHPWHNVNLPNTHRLKIRWKTLQKQQRADTISASYTTHTTTPN